MTKRLVIIVLAAIMLFGVFGLAACNNISLEDYKADAKASIQAHADAKGRVNYCLDGWATIEQAVTAGKQAVEDAATKPQVDAAVADAKTAINAVEREDANLEWTNSNAVYAFVKAGFESEILKDIEGSFATLSFQKVYVTEKNINTWTPLALLFILNEGGAEKQQEFRELLNQDERINHASNSRDLPFETVDTRHIERIKDTIAVGEKLTLELKGSIDYYVQPFGFEGLLVKPTTNKTHTVADFPVDLKSVETRDNGWLYLELSTTKNCFEVLKAADVLSRLSTIEKVELDRSLLDLPPPAPPAWGISDYTIAEFVAVAQWDDYSKPIVKGLKAGTVTISYNGVCCEITVI